MTIINVCKKAYSAGSKSADERDIIADHIRTEEMQ